MRALQHWSLAQVLLVSLAWVILVLALTAGYVYVQIRAVMAATGSGGIGAVSSGFLLELILLGLLSGPAVLISAWVVLRRRS